MLALMTNIVQFAYWNVQKKRKTMVDGDKTVPASHWYKYRPVYLLMVSTVLVCLQPVCMMLIGSWICDGQFTADQIDLTTATWNATKNAYVQANGDLAGTYTPEGKFTALNNFTVAASGMMNAYFVDGCSPSMQNFFFDGGESNAIVPNTTTGWMIQIFGTYLGFITMFVGVCQATMLHVKIARKWADLRGTAK